MMRLLFLCLLLLLPAATAVSEDDEGSGNGETDDEDMFKEVKDVNVNASHDKTTGVDESSGHMTVVAVVVVATLLTLTIAVIGAIMIIRRQMRLRQQAIYTVPTEQNQKEAI